MKTARLISVFIAAAILLPLVFSACAAVNTPELVLVDRNESGEAYSDYVIVRGRYASASEVTAAEELQSYIKQMTGVEIPITVDENPDSEQSTSEKEIIIGKTNREGNSYTVDRELLGDEGYLLKVVGDDIVIAGGELRGTLYGVYTLLEDYFGCHWYSIDVKVIPEVDKLAVPSNLDESFKPSLFYREPLIKTTMIDNGAWSAFNKVNGMAYDGAYRNISSVYGGGEAPQLAHSFARLVPAEEYYAEHPEYFGDGVSTNQPCLSNPEVVNIIINNVIKQIEENPDVHFVNVSQNDYGSYCSCENCKRIIEEENGVSGYQMRVVNAVADAIKDRYPGYYVTTLAYGDTTKVPTVTLPRDNVTIVLCTSGACFSHAISDENCEENRQYREVIKDWSGIAKNLLIWNYDIYFSEYPAPFPNFDILQDNVKYFIENNAKGLLEQGDHENSVSPEFGELRSYLFAKLMWNPNCDYDAEMKRFLKAYYGAGWEYIYKYIEMTNEKSNDRHFYCLGMGSASEILDFSHEDVLYAESLWDSAESLAANDEELERIQRSRIQLKYFEVSGGRLVQTDLLEKKRSLYNDLINFGIDKVSEFNDIGDNCYSPNPARW